MQVVTRRAGRLIFLFVLLVFYPTAWGQEKEPKIVALKLSSGTVAGALPAGGILVHDVRFDTSSVGLEESAMEIRMIKLSKGFHGSIAEFFRTRTSFDKNSPLTLHFFVKRMVLSNHIYYNASQSSRKFDNVEVPGIAFTAELYLQDNNSNVYIPVFRIDTTITGQKQINFGGGQMYVEAALSACLKKMMDTNWQKLHSSGRKLEAKQLNEYYTKRFAIPILQTTEPTKGLYLSYDDFRNNKPHPIDFTVEEGDKGDFLYIKNEKGDQILQHELWGYCDGKDMFIFSASNYFKLTRNSNSFIIYGAKDFTARRAFRLNFSAADLINPNSNFSKDRTRTKYHLDQSFLLLDMDTGELF